MESSNYYASFQKTPPCPPDAQEKEGVNLPEIRPSDIIIAVMGITGAGKSTFIAQCSGGSDIKIGHGLRSCTNDIQIVSFKHKKRTIHLVDTPGFDDTNISDVDVLEKIALWLGVAYTSHRLLNGIIYLHAISGNRMQGSAVKNLRIFKKLVGEKFLPCIVLASTMWSDVKNDEGARRQQELVSTPEFWGDMVAKGSTVFQHDNSATSGLKICDYIVEKGQKLALDLQIQMVQGRTVVETEAGREIESALIAERQKSMLRLQQSEREMEDALRAHDQKAIEELAQLQDEYREKIEATTRGMQQMQISLERLMQEKEKEFRRQLEELQVARREDKLVFAEKLKEGQEKAEKQMEQQREWAMKALERTPPPPYTFGEIAHTCHAGGYDAMLSTSKNGGAEKIGAAAGVASAALAVFALGCQIM